jgi:hypothetical protein
LALVREQHALPGHEHHPPVVVLQARAPASGILDLVQDVDRSPGLDRFRGAVLELAGGVVANLGQKLRVELARKANLPDRVLVGERPVLPRLRHPLAVRGLTRRELEGRRS